MGMTEELRWTVVKLMNVGKFAVDYAVREVGVSLQVYAFVKGKLKAHPSSGLSNSGLSNGDKKKNVVLVEEMQAKLEKMQQDMNNIQQQSKASTLRNEEQEHLKHLFDEHLKSSTPEVPTGQRKIFIRSLLRTREKIFAIEQ